MPYTGDSPCPNTSGLSLCCRFCFWNKVPQGKVIHDILNLLHAVLDTIAAAPQGVVLQIQDLEAGVHVLNELTDLEGPLIIAQGNRVDGQSRKLFYERDQGLEVLLNGDMECVLVLEINRNCWRQLGTCRKVVRYRSRSSQPVRS